jgi:hypothetical protein
MWIKAILHGLSSRFNEYGSSLTSRTSQEPDMPVGIASAYSDRQNRLKDVAWIADAPMFIDERQVERFFDAVVRPKFEHIDTTEEYLKEKENMIRGELGLSAEAKTQLPDWLKALKLDANAKLTTKGKAEIERKSHERNVSIAQLKPIWNAERQLEELTRHYLLNHPSNVVFRDGVLDKSKWPEDSTWWGPGIDLASIFPRPLAFMDFPQKTVVLLTAVEFENGKTELLFDTLAKKLADRKVGPSQTYPSDELKGEKRVASRREYWRSFHEHFKSRIAMEVVEDAAKKNGRISWIDFRILMDANGDTIHVHVTPNGSASAGVFGYNFVRRAYSHGVRIVGSVKSGPDVNILAIYER